MSDYLSQTDLGKLFVVSSHVIGRWLIECGLRTEDKKPSQKSFDEGLVRSAPTGRGSGYFYVWHREKTLRALQSAGHRLKGHPEPPSVDRLVGPFQAIRSSTNGYEISDSNGTVGIWVMGKYNADQVTAALNSSFRSGMLIAQ